MQTDAFRQLFGLLDEGLRRRPDYSELPLHATYTAIPEIVKKQKTVITSVNETIAVQ